MRKHPNDHQLLAYLDGDLSPRRREQTEAHMQDCPSCRARLERFARTGEELTATLRAVGEQMPLATDRSWKRVARRWNRGRARMPGHWVRMLVRPAAALAALMVVVVGLTGLIRGLAFTGLGPPEPRVATPIPATGTASVGGLLPRPDPDRLAAPISVLILGADRASATSDETDTLLLLHLDAEAEHAFMLSVPRDLYVEVPGHEQARAGSVYGIGERTESGGGLTLIRETVSNTLGLPVRYAVLVRFDAFIALIDAVGGVDIEVPHPIDDPRFPDGHGGYDPLSIPAGQQHFDGQLALRYARTRVIPAPGFDHAFRQQQLTLAVHERVKRLDLLPELIAQSPGLWAAVGDSLDMNLSLGEVIDLALLATDLDADAITSASLGECCTVEDTLLSGERVLLPQPGQIEALMEDLLEGER